MLVEIGTPGEHALDSSQVNFNSVSLGFSLGVLSVALA